MSECVEVINRGILMLVMDPDLLDSKMLFLNYVCTPILLYTHLNNGVWGHITPPEVWGDHPPLLQGLREAAP